MIRFVTMHAAVILALAAGTGCFEGPEIADASEAGIQDAYAPSDIQYLRDAVPLGENPASPDAGPIVSDVSGLDFAASDFGSPDFDSVVALDINDTFDPSDTVDPGDDSPSDTFEIPESIPCGPDNTPCQPDHICVEDATGVTACIPVGECSELGMIDEIEMIRMLIERQELYLKVKAQAWMGPASCTFLKCPEDDPCCNTCFAQLFIGTEFLPIVLLGQGLVFGCQGSECNMEGECRPMDPGDWYWVWGTASIQGGKAQFRVDGFCPIPTE
jgi:hypothetical protein